VTEYVEQAQVTNWPLRILLVLVVIAIVLLVLGAMWRSWRARAARQADIPPPALAGLDAAVLRARGLFLGTARAGDWLDRIVVHDLGVPSRAEVQVGSAGVQFLREGARDLFIPAADMRAVRTDRGIAGVVREKEGVIVLTWQLGKEYIESGFRPDDAREREPLLDSCMALVSE
jgi:hypothetical protein